MSARESVSCRGARSLFETRRRVAMLLLCAVLAMAGAANTAHAACPPDCTEAINATPSFVDLSIDEAQRIARKTKLKLVLKGLDKKAKQVIASQSPDADSPLPASRTIIVQLRSVSAANDSDAPQDAIVTRGAPLPASDEAPIVTRSIPSPSESVAASAPDTKKHVKTAPRVPPTTHATHESPTPTPIARAEPPASDPQVPTFASVDAMVATLRDGKAVFNVPTDVDVDEPCPCRIDFVLDAKKFEHNDVKMGPDMIATLSADPDDFGIDPKGAQRRVVSSTEPTAWTWMVTPKSWGKHTLRLELTALFTINGQPGVREIKTMSKNIEVTVTPFSLVRRFVEANWKWLWATLLIPLVRYLFKLRKRHLERELAAKSRKPREIEHRRVRPVEKDVPRELHHDHARRPQRSVKQ